MEKEVTVTISLKEGISDPEGKNVKKALALLGYDEVQDVKVERRYRIKLDCEDQNEAEQRVEAMSKTLLSNPVVHNFDISW